MPRGFESLEPRHALDGATISNATLTPIPLPLTLGVAPSLAPAFVSGASAPTNQALPLLGTRVYAAPIGPLPASVFSNTVTASPAGSKLSSLANTVLTPEAFYRLGTAPAFPIGPARPVNLPAPVRQLYAEGFQPPKTPVNLPTVVQTMPIVTAPPLFTPLPELLLY